MLYQIKDGTVSAGGQTILSHIDFYIKEKEKLAVVGKNGAGKTTLLKLLAGELTPDRDDSRGSYGRSHDFLLSCVYDISFDAHIFTFLYYTMSQFYNLSF